MKKSELAQLTESLSTFNEHEFKMLLITIFNSSCTDLNSYRDIINGIAAERIASRNLNNIECKIDRDN